METTTTSPPASCSALLPHYGLVLLKAKEFEHVVRMVEDCPLLETPGGIAASRLTWRAWTGKTAYTGRICRLTSVIDQLIFSVHFSTPNTHPALWGRGEEIWTEDLPSVEHSGLVEAINRFAEKWRELITEDRYVRSDSKS